MKTRLFTLLFVIMANIGMLSAASPSWEYNGIYYKTLRDTVVSGDPFPRKIVAVSTPYRDLGTPGAAYEQVFGAYSGDIVIPAEFQPANSNYCYVQEIDNGAFLGCGITSISLPDSIKRIGQNAFSSCGLRSIEIPDGVRIIEKNAFQGCSSLEYVKIGKNLKTIAGDAFASCWNIKQVYWNVFWYWRVPNLLFPSHLEAITFGDEVAVVPAGICAGQRDLSTVTMSDNVTVIGEQAFYGCENLIDLHFPNALNQIESQAFANTGLWSITIPEPVYIVAEDAFAGCHPVEVHWNARSTGGGMRYIDFGPSVKRIYFGDKVEMIPQGVCKNNTNLEEVYIPASVTSIKESAFYGCTNLRKVSIGNRVESIGKDAFYNCVNLSSALNFPSSLQTIGSNAFYGCAKIPSVTVPENLQSIGTGAFYGCTNLKKVFNFSTMTLVPGSSDQGHVAYYARYVYNNMELQGDYIFGQSLSYDERYLLLGYVGNDIDLILPTTYKNSVYSIEQCTFMNAVQLTSVTIPNSVTKIKEAAFLGCTGLTSVTIPSSVTYVGQTAYEDCVNLNEIHCESQTPPTAFANTFTNVPKTIPLYIPAGSLSAYNNAPGWKLFTNVVETNLVNPTGVSLKETTLNLMKGEEVLLHASVSPSDATYKTLTWSSSDNTIATVTNGIVYGKKAGNATISCTTTHGGFTATCEVTVTDIERLATGLELYKSAYWKNGQSMVPYSSINEGDTLTFMELGIGFITINVLPYSVTNGEINWKVSDPSIVATELTEHINFANSIRINPLHVGTAKITISTTDGTNISKDVYVKITPDPTIKVSGIRLHKKELTLAAKETDTLSVQILPSNATNMDVDWTSSDLTLASVFKVSGTNRGVITAKNLGKTGPVNIICTTKDGNYSDTCVVTVIKQRVSVTGLALNNTSKTLRAGETLQLSPIFTPANPTNQNVYWYMDNDSVATVVNGLVTAIREGAVTITCVSEDGNYEATCAVTVTNEALVSVTGVSLNKKTLQMVVGNTATVTASVLPANASNKSVTWTSSNATTATVSSTGTISAKAEGVTTITCKTVDGNFTAECYVVVSAVNSEYTFSYEPTNATVINYTATELSYSEMPENNCVFAALADNAHTLNLMYVGSLVNGVIPQGNYKITSTLQNGTFCYSVGGDDQYDYGSYLATDYDSEGYYTSSYYIIAGDIIIGSNNNYTVKVISANGTDINVTYNGTQDVENISSDIKAAKILRDGQILILRGDKTYTMQGQEVK